MVKSDKCEGVSQLLGARARAAPPKSTPIISGSYPHACLLGLFWESACNKLLPLTSHLSALWKLRVLEFTNFTHHRQASVRPVFELFATINNQVHLRAEVL